MDVFGVKGNTPSSQIISNYRLENEIGEGGFAKVRRAVHIPTGIQVAIKIIDRRKINESTAEQVRREINILRLFSHPHIVRFYEAIKTKWKIYIVMEYVSCGDLHDHITVNVRIHEDEARRFFQQIISGVECCHLHLVSHRDLKPENILLDANRNVKIADFGLSNVMRDGRFLKENCGSQHYAAPEILQRSSYAGPEVDVWSCGVILYVLLCGRLPFEGDQPSVVLAKMLRGSYILPSSVSSAAVDLISRMLVVDPVSRLSISEICKHPWFRQHLPSYIAMPSSNAALKMEKINRDVIIDMAKMAFDVHGVIRSLQNGVRDKGTISYFLLLDNRHGGHYIYLLNEVPEVLLQDNSDRPEIYIRSTGQPHTKWKIGFQFQATPHKKMRDILVILHKLNVKWKGIGHYNIKCLWVPLIPTFANKEIMPEDCTLANHSPGLELSIATTSKISERSEDAVKFEIQEIMISMALHSCWVTLTAERTGIVDSGGLMSNDLSQSLWCSLIVFEERRVRRLFAKVAVEKEAARARFDDGENRLN